MAAELPTSSLIVDNNSPGVHGVSLGGFRDDNCVTDGQEDEELSHCGAHRTEVGLGALHQHLDIQVVQMFRQLRVGGDDGPSAVPHTVAVVVEVFPKQSAPLEDHLVLSEGPCLVTEHVLDLTQLLRNIQRSTLRAFVMETVVELTVVVDEVNLDQLGDLYRHVEGEGNYHLNNMTTV